QVDYLEIPIRYADVNTVGNTISLNLRNLNNGDGNEAPDLSGMYIQLIDSLGNTVATADRPYYFNTIMSTVPGHYRPGEGTIYDMAIDLPRDVEDGDTISITFPEGMS